MQGNHGGLPVTMQGNHGGLPLRSFLRVLGGYNRRLGTLLPDVIATAPKQPPIRGIEIASPAFAGAGFAALLAMTFDASR